MQNTSVQSDRLLVKGMLSMHLSTTRWVTCSWLMQLDFVAQKEGWASINTISSSGPQENKLYLSTPKSTQRNQFVSPYMHLAAGLPCSVNRSCTKRQQWGVTICCTPLKSFHTKKNLKQDCFQLYNQMREALSNRAFASQITGNFQQILLLPVKTHIQGNSIQCSQNLVKESSAPMVAVLASRYWNSFHQ